MNPLGQTKIAALVSGEVSEKGQHAAGLESTTGAQRQTQIVSFSRNSHESSVDSHSANCNR